MTFLRDRDWQFPIGELVSKVYESKTHSPMELEKLQITLGTIMREWHFLSLIWERLQNEIKERFEALEERLRLKRQTKDSELTRKFMHNSSLIHLDTEDFLIHAKILLDRVAILTKEFFTDKIVRKGNEPPDGFTRFRSWLVDEKHSSLILDVELAKYLRFNADWYDKLQYARDKLIVHAKGYYIDSLREQDKRIIIGRARPKFDSDRNIIDWRKVEDLPDLNELMDGITEFLYFYDKHFSQMLEESN